MLKYKPISRSIIAQFKKESELLTVKDPETECWNWKGMTDKHGYGYINEYFSRDRSLHYFVHRISFKIHNPKINIDSKIVRHRCDNPSCWNPDHLLSGTQADNITDAISRGRNCKGQRSNFAKYSDGLIAKIRKDYSVGGTNYNRLSKKYGLSRAYVRQLILGDRRT